MTGESKGALMRPVRLRFTGTRKGNLIEVAGHDLTEVCTRVHVDAYPRGVPRLRLDLAAWPVEINGEMHVAIHPKMHAALVAIGWTPPDGDSGGGADA